MNMYPGAKTGRKTCIGFIPIFYKDSIFFA